MLLVGVAIGTSIGFAAQGKSSPSSPSPNTTDIGFSQDMIVHHTQAVTMAQAVLIRASTPEIRSIANTILVAQLNEIGTMQGWLSLWNAPPIGKGAPMSWMIPNHVGSSSDRDVAGMSMAPATSRLMPGMASQAELDRLSTLSGHHLDIMFLQLMIRHHQGGIEMATYASNHAALTQVRALADRMVLEQSQEINLMTQLLTADRAKPLPFSAAN